MANYYGFTMEFDVSKNIHPMKTFVNVKKVWKNSRTIRSNLIHLSHFRLLAINSGNCKLDMIAFIWFWFDFFLLWYLTYNSNWLKLAEYANRFNAIQTITRSILYGIPDVCRTTKKHHNIFLTQSIYKFHRKRTLFSSMLTMK